MRGEVKDRGDDDAGEAAKSLGHAAAMAPSHGPVRLPIRRRVELVWSGQGSVAARVQ